MTLKEKLNKLSIIELVIIAEPHTDYTDEAKTHALDLLKEKNWENDPHIFDEIKNIGLVYLMNKSSPFY